MNRPISQKVKQGCKFNQVRLRIYRHPAIDLHDVMTEFGYYDYAHFSKDFKESFGLTPNEYKKWMMEMMHASKKRQKDVVFLQEE
ncbi:helix-turn-helix domain-containing protein [Neobacillus drentensis]